MTVDKHYYRRRTVTPPCRESPALDRESSIADRGLPRAEWVRETHP